MSFISNIIARAKGESLTLGIDVGHYSIKMVLVHHRQQSPKILAVRESVLDEGLVLSGEIHNQLEVRKVLKQMVESIDQHFLDMDVAISIPWANGVLADCIKIKKNDNSPDNQVILFEAGSRPPFDDQNITLDYKILSKDTDKNELDVLLVAAKNGTLGGIAEFFISTDLPPFVLDVDVFALLNSASRVVELSGSDVEVRAILMIGEERGHITFIKQGLYHSTREISSASVSYLMKTISRSTDISIEDIKTALTEGESNSNYSAITSSLEDALSDLTTAVNSSISYFQSSEPGFIVDEILLSGGGALLPGVDQEFANNLRITVAILDSFEGLKIDTKLLEGENAITPYDRVRMSVALGLAMRAP